MFFVADGKCQANSGVQRNYCQQPEITMKVVQNVAENSDTQLYLNSDIVESWIVGRVSEMVNIFIHISLFFIDVFLKQKSVGNSRLLTIHF